MGMLYMEDDIYIGSQLDLLNIRFAPPQGVPNQNETSPMFGGIEEMVALQKEFQIFKVGRSFRTSVSVLNVGGFWNLPLKNKLYRYLDTLSSRKASVSGKVSRKNGNDSLVDAMIKNLESKKGALPVYFLANKSKIVTIETSRPLSYLNQDYLTVSFPMWPRN